MTAGSLDWAGLLRAGLHDLRLSPDAFWRLTPVELAVMTGRAGQAGPLGRSALEALMQAFPDGGPSAASKSNKDVTDG